jgi:hypothetical protein
MKEKLNRFTFIAVILAVFSLNLAAQERQVLPVDEAAKDASFKLFRDKLISAVRKRDSKYVLSIVDPKIQTGFGGEDGIANFKKQWKINMAKSPLWDELLFVLTHGGSFDARAKNKTFYAPYVYSKFPENLDAFEYSAIIEKNVKLLATPFAAAPVVATLNYSVVKVDFENSIKSRANPDNYTWLKVTTLGGKKGFVQEKFVRSSIDYRAGFEKKRGQWKLTFFLAGD